MFGVGARYYQRLMGYYFLLRGDDNLDQMKIRSTEHKEEIAGTSTIYKNGRIWQLCVQNQFPIWDAILEIDHQVIPKHMIGY